MGSYGMKRQPLGSYFSINILFLRSQMDPKDTSIFRTPLFAKKDCSEDSQPRFQYH